MLAKRNIAASVRSSTKAQDRHPYSHRRQMATSASPSFKFAAIQLAVGKNKSDNLEHAKAMIKQAADNGAKVVALPVR